VVTVKNEDGNITLQVKMANEATESQKSMDRLTISFGFAQSIYLSHLEAELDELWREVSVMPKTKDNDLLDGLIRRALQLKNDLNFSDALVGAPLKSLVEKNPNQLSPFHFHVFHRLNSVPRYRLLLSSISQELLVNQRLSAFNTRLEGVHATLQQLYDHTAHKNSYFLEWLITTLLSVEVAFALLAFKH
jgi:hypothetical protein